MTLQGSCPPGSDSGSRFSASWHTVSRIATAEEEGAWSWHIGSSVPGAGSDTNMRDYEVYSSFPGSGDGGIGHACTACLLRKFLEAAA